MVKNRFGRPGAGAPNYGISNKKNLGEMLEPRGGRGSEPGSGVAAATAAASNQNYQQSRKNYQTANQSYQPSMSTSASFNSLFPQNPQLTNRFRSNHHNNYELSATKPN